MRQTIAAAVAVGLAVSSLAARADTPIRVRGVVTELAGDRLAVKTRAGETVLIQLAEPTTVLVIFNTAPADIQPGSSVGIAAVPQPDGASRALEVLVAPPGKKTNPVDGPWDLTPTSTMTNGTVTNGTGGSLVAANGRTITVNYGTGERKIVVPDDVPVVSYEPGDRTLIVPGAQVVVFARKADDGRYAAAALAIGKNGVVPPM